MSRDRPDPDASSDFESRSRELFDASVERLDGRTRSRLTQARHAALEQLSARGPWRQGLRLPAAGLAMVALAAIVVFDWTRVEPPAGAQGGLPLDDFDIVAESGELEMLQDVDFYVWLADGAALPENHSG